MSLKLTADCRVCGKFRTIEIRDFICQECHDNAPERQWIYERNQRCLFIAIITLMLLLGFARCVYVCSHAGQSDVTVREAKDWNEVPERLRK